MKGSRTSRALMPKESRGRPASESRIQQTGGDLPNRMKAKMRKKAKDAKIAQKELTTGTCQCADAPPPLALTMVRAPQPDIVVEALPDRGQNFPRLRRANAASEGRCAPGAARQALRASSARKPRAAREALRAIALAV